MLENYDALCRMYLDNMRFNSFSPDSIDSYSRTFAFFRSTLMAGNFSEPCPAAVAAFKRDRSGAALTTMNLYLTHLRLLSEFGLEMGKLSVTFVPDTLLPPKKKVANARKKDYDHVLTEEQVVALLTADKPVYGQRKSRTWLREKAEVSLLLQSGLRNSELRSLTLADLDFASGLINARETKGDKPRCVAFPAAAQTAVKVYLKSGLRPAQLPTDAPLFGCIDRASGAWKALCRQQLSDLTESYVSSVLGEGCRTHALRHAYASVLLEHNEPIQFISESLGHSSLATTTIYARRLTRSAPAQSIGDVFSALVPAAV